MDNRPGSVSRVDLGDGRVLRSPVNAAIVRRFLGGQGVDMAVLHDVLTADLDPLSPAESQT